MVKHVVMWKLDSTNNEDKLDKMSEMENMLLELADSIEDVVTLEVGRNFNGGDAAYDLVLITTHTSRDSLNQYQEHPDHVKVASHIKSLVQKRTVVDFEI